MFEFLLVQAQEIRAGLFERMNAIKAPQSVQGASLEIDERWLAWWLEQEFNSGRRFYRYPWSYAGLAPGDVLAFINEYYHTCEPQIGLLPDWWSQHCRDVGYIDKGLPLRIRIILRRQPHADTGQVTENNLPREHNGMPIVYEQRPPLVASSMLGRLFGLSRLSSESFGLTANHDLSTEVRNRLSVGCQRPKQTAGTIGAFLRNRSGQHFVVSCAHVLGNAGTTIYAPGPYENHGLNEIGHVVWHALPELKVPGSACNMYAAPDAGRLDVAVAQLNLETEELASAEHLVRMSGVQSPAIMSPTQTIGWIGKESGYGTGHIGGATIWHEVQFPDGPRCFGQLFEINIGRSSHSIRPGDSGSCVYSELSSQYFWNGMIIAAFHDRAYCCFAQAILEGARNYLGEDIALLN